MPTCLSVLVVKQKGSLLTAGTLSRIQSCDHFGCQIRSRLLTRDLFRFQIEVEGVFAAGDGRG